MKIKEQTRQLAAGCSKHCFEVVIELTWFEEIFKTHIYTARQRWLTWFGEIFEEYKLQDE
ncbi:hypothetical protein [Streptococcus pneumoniae]|uniref:hypothetical protein n=1 Tax=Streptococcus pneumoniae TaxID=1313 RepID=UPI0015DB016C|nr:hypothetical protein [Streptococcus pneumoniae]